MTGMRGFLFGLAAVVVAGTFLVDSGSLFSDAAQAQTPDRHLPAECADDPDLDWRCLVIARDEPGIASQLLEDNCIRPTLLAPFEIDGRGHVVSYVLVGRVIEGCEMADHTH